MDSLQSLKVEVTASCVTSHLERDPTIIIIIGSILSLYKNLETETCDVDLNGWHVWVGCCVTHPHRGNDIVTR